MKILLILSFTLILVSGFSQTSSDDSLMVKRIFNEALSNNESYSNLEYLCKNIGGRICGSPQAAAAVEYTYQLMKQMPFDTVFLQATKVAAWKRGKPEKGRIISPSFGQFDVNVCALGGSVGTGKSGVLANVIEVADIEELNKLKTADVKGKIVFFNKPFNPTYFYTFQSYGEVAGNRFHGPKTASEMGASAVIVRSLTHLSDTITHTGITKYLDVKNPIPSFAISTIDADKLSELLKSDASLKVYLESDCQVLEDMNSFNVIGEIKGSTYPDRIISVGGHIDAWDNGEGAHDDGVGSMQSIEVARIFFKLGIKPQNTLRVVIFMDEEMNQRGAKTYADEIISENEKHYFAFESDRGGFSPLGFSVDADSSFMVKMNLWFGLLYDYGVYKIEKGYSGVDVFPLKKYNIPLAALITDSQRYFDYQHGESDKFEAVNHREMQLGSAAIASFIYFIDKLGY